MADVDSSKINILVLFIRERAIAILCFSPPDNLFPFSPTKELIPSGSLDIKLERPDLLHILKTSSSL